MENNNQNNKEEYLLPKDVLAHVNNLIGKGAHTLSTVIETEFYTWGVKQNVRKKWDYLVT